MEILPKKERKEKRKEGNILLLSDFGVPPVGISHPTPSTCQIAFPIHQKDLSAQGRNREKEGGKEGRKWQNSVCLYNIKGPQQSYRIPGSFKTGRKQILISSKGEGGRKVITLPL